MNFDTEWHEILENLGGESEIREMDTQIKKEIKTGIIQDPMAQMDDTPMEDDL